MIEYRSHLLSVLVPQSERDYHNAVLLAYENAKESLYIAESDYKRARLTTIINALESEMKQANIIFRKDLKGEILDITELDNLALAKEHSLTVEAITGAGAVTLYGIPRQKIKELVKINEMSFSTLDKAGKIKRSYVRVNDIALSPSASATRKARSIIMAGAIAGDTPHKIALDLKAKIVTQQFRDVRTIVSTMLHDATTKADIHFYENEADEVNKGYIYIAVLDQSTSSICRSLDGKKWDSLPAVDLQPPLHPNCRSRLAGLPYGTTNGMRPVNTMEPEDYDRADAMQKDYLKHPSGSEKRILGVKKREDFLKSKVFEVPTNITYKQMADLYPALQNKKFIDIDEYIKKISY